MLRRAFIKRTPLKRRQTQIKPKPKRNRVFRDGRTQLASKSELREQVFARAEERCERKIDGIRCNKPATLGGVWYRRGHLAHKKHGHGFRDDTMESCECWCGDCHRESHGHY